MSGQEIVFGENLLEYSRETDTDGVITALVPYGAQIKEEDSSGDGRFKKRITIEEVNGGSDRISVIKNTCSVTPAPASNDGRI